MGSSTCLLYTSAPIDYGAVYEKLAAARADSLSYLGAAIEGAPRCV